MKKNIKLLSVLLVVMFSVSMLSAKEIVINYEKDWFPYTFQKNGKATGIHIDIVKQAAKKAGYDVKFVTVPWKRCLLNVKKGKSDGVIGASYKDKRAAFAYYPRDAKRSKKSKWRVDQVEYVVVTMKSNKYNYKGKLGTLPQPVRAPYGYSIVGDLKKEGLNVDTAKNDDINFRKMFRDKDGCVVTNPLVAKQLNRKGKFKGKLHISKKPIKSKSYHIIFSKNGSISKADGQKIWNQIKKIRSNKRKMLKIYRKY